MYTCNNPQLLVQLNQTLDRVLSEFRQALSAEQGLIIRPQITKRVKKIETSNKAKNGTCSAISSLPLYKKRGRSRADSKYRNRVGKRAEHLRNVQALKQLHVHVHLHPSISVQAAKKLVQKAKMVKQNSRYINLHVL